MNDQLSLKKLEVQSEKDSCIVQRDEISKLMDKISGIACELSILHTEKLDTTSALKNLEESFLVVDESSKIFQQKESEATAQISELIAELCKVKAEHKMVSEEKAELQDHYNARQKEFTDLTLQLDAKAVEVNDKSVIVDSLKVALLELKSQISTLNSSNIENLEKLANVQGEMTELKASLVGAEKKIAEDEESRRVELDETIQQIRDDEQDRALDSEAEVTEHYKKRETSLKKQFVDFQADANRKVRLAEKRVAMFKNMYNKIKNEKLELVPIGNEKYLFLSEKDTLNLSQMSDVKVDAQENYLDSHADYQQVEALITEISILKKNVEQAEQAKNRLMTSNLATQEIETLKTEIGDLRKQLAAQKSDLETSKQSTQSLSTELASYAQQQSDSNHTIHELAQKIGGSLAKRKLSLELNGSSPGDNDLFSNNWQKDDQLALLVDLTLNVDGLLSE